MNLALKFCQLVCGLLSEVRLFGKLIARWGSHFDNTIPDNNLIIFFIDVAHICRVTRKFLVGVRHVS